MPGARFDRHPESRDGRKTASFGARLLAMVIDLTLLATVHLLVFLLTGHRLLLTLPADFRAAAAAAAVYLVLFFTLPLFLSMLYFTLLHSWQGQTLGKMVLGITVTARDGAPPAPGASFLRWTGYFLSALPFGGGFLWAAVDRDGCAWHDRLAGTTVVWAPEKGLDKQQVPPYSATLYLMVPR